MENVQVSSERRTHLTFSLSTLSRVVLKRSGMADVRLETNASSIASVHAHRRKDPYQTLKGLCGPQKHIQPSTMRRGSLKETLPQCVDQTSRASVNAILEASIWETLSAWLNHIMLLTTLLGFDKGLGGVLGSWVRIFRRTWLKRVSHVRDLPNLYGKRQRLKHANHAYLSSGNMFFLEQPPNLI